MIKKIVGARDTEESLFKGRERVLQFIQWEFHGSLIFIYFDDF